MCSAQAKTTELGSYWGPGLLASSPGLLSPHQVSWPSLRSMQEPLWINTSDSGKKKSLCIYLRDHSGCLWSFSPVKLEEDNVTPCVSVASVSRCFCIYFLIWFDLVTQALQPTSGAADTIPAHILVTGSHTWQNSNAVPLLQCWASTMLLPKAGQLGSSYMAILPNCPVWVCLWSPLPSPLYTLHGCSRIK